MLRIGNFSAYWGDDPEALLRQLRGGPVDYLTGDYLAELTMAILERHRLQNARAGYATHFVEQLRVALPELAKTETRIVVNAGGVNPASCREAVLRACADAGVSLPIGIVSGSDVLASFPGAGLLSAHAYLGARPIAEALKLGARIVITTRVTDAALALGPMLASFEWDEHDWDRLAAGTIAGHVLECGAQATGGVYTDFERVPLVDARLGYPIVEIESDGTFTVTKHPGTGGVVTIETVAEQLLYEIGDPRAYLTPDVTADFTSITIEQKGRDRVRVSGARGEPPPAELKVSGVYDAGSRASAYLLVASPRVKEKCARVLELLGKDYPGGFADTDTQILGDTVLRLAVRDADRTKVDRFVRTLLGLFVQGPPGVTMIGGRPHTEDAFGFRPELIARERVVAEVEVIDGDRVEKRTVNFTPLAARPPLASVTSIAPQHAQIGTARRARLRAIAHARSGDKGDRANIGVRARSAAAYDYLARALTAERVFDHFRDRVGGPVERYELPNLRAFNFVLDRALGGGGSISLRTDPLGKTMSDALLEMELDLPAELFSPELFSGA